MMKCWRVNVLKNRDPSGQKVIRFVHFRHVDSHFVFFFAFSQCRKVRNNITKKEIFAAKKQFD